MSSSAGVGRGAGRGADWRKERASRRGAEARRKGGEAISGTVFGLRTGFLIWEVHHRVPPVDFRGKALAGVSGRA
jgi:hypothetical protein